MESLLNTVGKVNFMEFIKEKSVSKLGKKAGIDKLLITLFLTAMGLGLCIYFRNSTYTMFVTGITTMTSKVNDLMSGTVDSTTTGGTPIK